MFIFLYLCLIVAVSCQNTSEIKVKTRQGTVVGFKDDTNYISFYGVPYGGDVTGKKRFKAASPPSNFQEFRADKKIICAQPTIKGIVGEENCLTLNIFTKNVTGSNPVYIWVNGEDYSRTNDTPVYSFKSLVQADIVVIALNYRLSIFGFLCLGVEEAPGNAGLKDVILALKWVKANIAAFGGDPENVVLLGHGSGAAMVDLVTLSPQSKDLVHKAVVISGSGIAPWAVAFDPVDYAKAVGAELNYTDNNLKKLAENLANTTETELVNAINKINKFTNSTLLFAPCIENVQLSDPFLEDAPINLIKSGNYAKLPYVAIYVSDEGTLRAQEAIDGNWLERMQENFDVFLPADLKFENENTKRNTSKTIREYYFNLKTISRETINSYIAYWGDFLVTIPMIRGVRERVAVENGSKSLIFVMKFDFTEVSDPARPYHEQIPLQGTQHGAILKYIFDLDSKEVATSPKNFLSNRIIAFAKTGIPIAPSSPGDVDWPTVTSQRFLYLNSGGEEKTSSYNEYADKDPESQTMNVWFEISKYHVEPYAQWRKEELVFAPDEESSGNIMIPVVCVIVGLIALGGVAIFYKYFKHRLAFN